jgi:hypothetical protein
MNEVAPGNKAATTLMQTAENDNLGVGKGHEAPKFSNEGAGI